MSQGLVSLMLPAQKLPFADGGGLSQVRNLVWTALPQFPTQLVQLDHVPQLPSAETPEKRKLRNVANVHHSFIYSFGKFINRLFKKTTQKVLYTMAKPRLK